MDTDFGVVFCVGLRESAANFSLDPSPETIDYRLETGDFRPETETGDLRPESTFQAPGRSRKGK